MEDFDLQARFNHVAALMNGLVNDIHCPDGHVASFDQEYTRRWIVKHNMMFGTSGSVHIRHATADITEPDQFKVEVRVFFDRPEAILFVSYGPSYNFKARDLLKGNERFVYADDYEDLILECALRVNEAIARVKRVAMAA